MFPTDILFLLLDSNHLVPAPSIVTVTYTDKDVTVVWKRVSNYFKHYELCISSAGTKIEQYLTSNTFYKLDFLKHDITYHAKVRGIIFERNLSRVYGKWSKVKTFSLKSKYKIRNNLVPTLLVPIWE